MSKTEQLRKLEETLEKHSVRIIYDVIKSEGGLCRVRDKYYLIVNRNLTLDQQIAILTKSLLAITEIVNKSNP